MNRKERVRQIVSGPLDPNDLKQRAAKGWKLAAIEWEREVDATEPLESDRERLPGEVPFGLQIVPEAQRLEEDPDEREILFQMMELIVQEGSYARIADEMNRRGFRARQGTKWSPVSVFEMLPRLIEVGPRVFQSSEWQKRRQQLTSGGAKGDGTNGTKAPQSA
jgi:recombinase